MLQSPHGAMDRRDKDKSTVLAESVPVHSLFHKRQMYDGSWTEDVGMFLPWAYSSPICGGYCSSQSTTSSSAKITMWHSRSPCCHHSNTINDLYHATYKHSICCQSIRLSQSGGRLAVDRNATRHSGKMVKESPAIAVLLSCSYSC